MSLKIILVSSANNMKFASLEASIISLIKRINSNGPNMDPWGTPHLTRVISDTMLSTDTYCFRLLR